MEVSENARVRELGEGFLRAALLPVRRRRCHFGGLAREQLECAPEVVAELGGALEHEVRGAAPARAPNFCALFLCPLLFIAITCEGPISDYEQITKLIWEFEP